MTRVIYPEKDDGIRWRQIKKAQYNEKGIPGILSWYEEVTPPIYEKRQLSELVITPTSSKWVCPNCKREYAWNTQPRLCYHLECSFLLGKYPKAPFNAVFSSFMQGQANDL